MRPSPARVCRLTLVGWQLAGLTLDELWFRYVGLGGTRDRSALARYLGGRTAWPALEHDALAQTLNEALWELGCPSVAPLRHLRDLRPVFAVGPGRL